MLSSSKNYLFFSSDRCGSVDAIVPLFIKLNITEKAAFSIVFPERRALVQMLADPLLTRVTKDLNIKLLCVDRAYTEFWSDIWRLCMLIIRPGNRVIFSRSLNGPKIRLVLLLTKLLRGKNYEAPRQKVPIKFKGIPRKTANIPYLYQEEGDFLVLENSGRKGGVCIGYPCFYSDWIAFIKSVAPSIIQGQLPDECVATDFFSVFLGSTVSGIFEIEEQKTFINEVLSAIRDIASEDAFIFLKPHPTNNIDEIHQFIPESLRKRVVVTSTNASVLASVSRLVICRHSSTILDVVALEKPVILFQKFSAHWKKVHADKSCYLQLGIRSAEDLSELKVAISDILVGNHATISSKALLVHKEPATLDL